MVVIEIPESNTAPHIHKDGRVYRRVADGSEPKHESDRFVLDQLWRRAEPIEKLTREWIERDPEFSKGEEETPYLRLLLCVDPWCQRDPWLGAPLSEIRNIFTGNELGVSSIPFDMVYTTLGGVIARQIKNNYSNILGLTWKLRRDMSCEILLPLPLYSADSPGLLSGVLDGYEYGQQYIKALKKQGRGHMGPKVADFNFATHVLIGVVAKYRRLLDLVGSSRDFYFKGRLLNAWRTLPFLDVGAVVRGFETHGVPMVLTSTVSIPDGYDPNSFLHVQEAVVEERVGKEQIASALQAFQIFAQIAIALGVPVLVEGDGEQGQKAVEYEDWMGAGERAILRQNKLNE